MHADKLDLTITPQLLKLLRADINAALATVATKYHLASLTAGNATYTKDGSFTIKVNGLAAGGLTREQSAYDQLRDLYGLPERGSTFTTYKGDTFRIDGLARDKVTLERADGKRFKATPDWIKAQLARKAA
jgi:hypothetical protein